MKIGSGKVFVLLFLVILLASALRFYRLGEVPPGFTNDEANIGYDAYSILKTGKDQWGVFIPLASFRGFGDNRPPLYTYLTTGSEFFFGLNEFAVRFPSALFGILTVILTYFLAKQLFKSETIGITAAVFLAINPWHIGVSRVGIESNLSVFLTTLGVLLFLLALKNLKLFFISLILLALTLYTYTANLIFTSLLLGALFLIYKNQILKVKKIFLLSTVVFLVLLVPLILSYQQSSGGARFNQVNLTNDIGLINNLNEKRGECIKGWSPIFCQAVFNKGVAYSLTYLKNYVRHFSPELLVINGTSTQLSILPPRGLLYFFDFFLLICGLFYLLKRKDGPSLLILSWIFLAPVPDSFTGSGHYSRFLVIIPALQIAESYGFYELATRNIKRKVIWLVVLLVFVFFGLISFLPEYYSYFPRFFSRNSHYGYKRLFNYLNGVKNNYDEIIISSRVNDTKQYIFYLFFTGYDPAEFQNSKEVVKSQESNGWIKVARVDNFYFVPSLPSGEELRQKEGKMILVASPNEFPPKMSGIYELYDLKGDSVFKIVEAREYLDYFESKRSF